jgi:N6-adenosine-specific RNA methylase IME4
VFQTLSIDPPWPYGRKWGGFKADTIQGGKGHKADRALPFPEMPVAEIASLEVGKIALPAARCFLWTTNRFLPDAFAVLDAWGFRYGQTLIWAKTPMGRGPGHLFAQNAEYILMGTRGSVPRIAPREVSVWFNWKRTGTHSEKPSGFYRLAERVSPGPYVEMFARGKRAGWTVLGDEIDGLDIRAAMRDLG